MITTAEQYEQALKDFEAVKHLSGNETKLRLVAEIQEYEAQFDDFDVIPIEKAKELAKTEF